MYKSGTFLSSVTKVANSLGIIFEGGMVGKGHKQIWGFQVLGNLELLETTATLVRIVMQALWWKI